MRVKVKNTELQKELKNKYPIKIIVPNNPKDFSKNKENIDYKSFILYLLYYWKLFVITVITAIIIAKFMNGFLEEQYRLSSLISVKEETNPLFSTGTNIAFNWGGASDEIQTIQTILRSRSHNEKVVKETKFYISYLKEGKYRLKDVYGLSLIHI